MRKLVSIATGLGFAVLLSGCAHRGGANHVRPDEFAVGRQAPLMIPPDFALTPPRPGAAVPGAARGRLRALPWTVLGVLVLLASTWPLIHKYLLDWPDEIWLVDLEVYREGAHSLVDGRGVYAWLTDNPQYLPFTYPPFGALMGTVMLLAPFRAVGWAWTAMQLVLLWVCTGIAFRPFLARFGRRSGLAQGAVAAVLVQLQVGL